MSPPNCVGLTVCITARYSSLLPKALLICCLLAPPASSGKGGGNRERERGERFTLFSFFSVSVKINFYQADFGQTVRLQHGVIVESCYIWMIGWNNS